MNKFQQVWDTNFRKHRLLLVTSVQEEVIDWLEGMNFHSIEKDGRTVVLRGKTKNEESVIVSIGNQHPFKHVNVSIFQNDTEVIWTGALMPEVMYNKKNFNKEESAALKSFFRNTYDNCDSYLASTQGEIV